MIRRSCARFDRMGFSEKVRRGIPKRRSKSSKSLKEGTSFDPFMKFHRVLIMLVPICNNDLSIDSASDIYIDAYP
jgi:hypothetical protein